MQRTAFLIIGLSIGFTTGFIAGHAFYSYQRDKHMRFMREHIRLLKERLANVPSRTPTPAEMEETHAPHP